MEDHMTSSDNTGTGNSFVTMVTDSTRTDPNLQDLCDRVRHLEQKAGSHIQSDIYLMNRIMQLKRSEGGVLCQLTPRMQHSQRLDHRLHMLREEVRAMTQEKEREERVWRERLQRCQRQLKAKEDEMSRQSQYFENFKSQLQHKLSLAQDREKSLQNRIYTLEKQLLDMTVSAATGAAVISAVRITAGTLTCWEQQERLTSMRGEGEGEEERKEERRKQRQPSVGTESEGRQEGDEGKTEKDTGGERNKETRQSSNEARLQGFILSLQEDLRVLLDREEDGMTERRRLMEQLQEAQENSHFLGCQVEEMKAEMQQLKLSESSLMEEAEELREENHRLQQILREAANQTPSQSSQISESTCQSLGTSSPNCSTVACPGSSNTTTTHSFVGGSGEVQGATEEELDGSYSSAVPPDHHQVAAQTTQKNTDDHSSPAKVDPLNLSAYQGSKTNLSFQSLSLTTETIDEFKVGTWCTRGILKLEENPSEESDALREAYKSLGLQEDLEALQGHSDSLGAALQHTQQQLQVMSEENTRLKLHLRKQAKEEAEAEQGSTREKIISPSSYNGADNLQPSSTHDNTILSLTQDDLVLALNQENRALADRIQEMLAHIELREEEVKKEETQQKELISQLEENRVKLEQENQEQGCLITELTRKTEDDLNTIMDLQQKLEESREQNNLKECVDSMGDSVLNREEQPRISSQQIVDLSTASAPGSQHNNPNDSLQNSPQNTLHVSTLADQVDQLTKSIQILKTEQEELLGHINCLREQQKEVSLSVQTQTEEKQHLTRTVWGLKEEKDNTSKSLAGLKQEREELSRTVSGLKDNRDHFIRSMSGLKEEKEQITKSLSGLEKEKEALMESLSSGKEERDQILQSLQRLQRENCQLSQEVLNLKQERDELTNSLKYLKEKRDQNQLSYTLQEDHNKLIKSINSLREEKEQVQHSFSCLKQEEKQIRLKIQGLIAERNSVQTAFTSQTQTEETDQKQHLLNPNGAEEYDIERCQINNVKGNSIQEQSDLKREIEALGGQLKRSREELEKTCAEMHSELCQSEVRREEAERKATQAVEKVKRLTDLASQVEETRKENESLNIQLRELQSKLTGVVREKADAQSLKTQIEEQYNIVSAQLRAKSVALEELNSEYIALKQGQGSKNDLSAVVTSLRTRYNDIRAKYDALLKRKSQTDLDVAPLKAKLSCLVVKCQERNNLLVQMMKAMHRHGWVDSTLTQQVEQLLNDSALQDYTAAFTPGSSVNTQDYNAGFTLGFISKLSHYSSAFTPDPTCPAVLPPVNNQHLNGFSESGVKCRDLKSDNHTSHAYTTRESTANLQDCSSEVKLDKNASSAVPSSPVQEHISSHDSPSQTAPLKEALNTNTTQLFSSACGSEKLPCHHPDMKGKSSPGLTTWTGSSLSPSSPLSSQRVSPSRRLSSPEKIMNLHEQLQKTLKSSYQAPVSRGREQQPRKSLLFSAPADLISASQTKGQTFNFNNLHTNSPQVTTASCHTTDIPVIKPTANNKSPTLFNAVASRLAHVSLRSNMFTDNHIKAVVSKPTTSAQSGSSNFPLDTMASNKVKSISSSSTNVSVSTTLTKEITDICDEPRSASSPLTPRATSVDSALSICSDTNLKTAASGITDSSMSATPKVNNFNMTSKMDGAAPSYNDFAYATSCTPTTHRSPENSNKSARQSPVGLEKTKRARPKPEAPAQVRAVEVIRTVGQSSLMIGWERPPLDELGYSNGTFVYGYRVFIDGDFHKSVMSSACTKCILENVDLGLPIQISVQTLGSNGLSSNSVHIMYRTDQN